MNINFVLPRKMLLKNLEKQYQEISNLKIKLESTEFVLDNAKTILKYQDKFITPDIVVLKAFAIKKNVQSIPDILQMIFGLQEKNEPKLMFTCKDMKTETSFDLTLKEVEDLANEYNLI